MPAKLLNRLRAGTLGVAGVILVAVVAGTATPEVAGDADDVTQSPPVPPPGGSQEYPNEPEGFAVITQRDFNALDEDGWRHVVRSGRAVPADGGDLYRIVQDPTAPQSPDNVAMQVFTPGVDGGEPAIVWRDFPDRATRQMYVSVWVKLSENWQGHRSWINKVFYARIGGVDTAARGMLIARGQGDGPLIAFGVTQGTPLGDGRLLPPNTGAHGVMERGRWHHAELLFVGNEGDAYDGQYHMWLNGEKIAEYTDVIWTSSHENQDWWGIEWTPIWGGAGDRLNGEQRMWVDQFYISGNS